MFTTSEAADLLDITPGRVRQLVVVGTIQAEKLGRDLFISYDEIQKAKKRRKGRGPAKPKKGRAK